MSRASLLYSQSTTNKQDATFLRLFISEIRSTFFLYFADRASQYIYLSN